MIDTHHLVVVVSRCVRCVLQFGSLYSMQVFKTTVCDCRYDKEATKLTNSILFFVRLRDDHSMFDAYVVGQIT
jgi:hypothetical protein